MPAVSSRHLDAFRCTRLATSQTGSSHNLCRAPSIRANSRTFRYLHATELRPAPVEPLVLSAGDRGRTPKSPAAIGPGRRPWQFTATGNVLGPRKPQVRAPYWAMLLDLQHELDLATQDLEAQKPMDIPGVTGKSIIAARPDQTQ